MNQFIQGFFVALIMGILAYMFQLISVSGMIGGVILGTVIYGATGWQGFMVPLTFVIIGSVATKIGYNHKASLGIAQEEGGKRGAKHALANILAGMIFALLAMYFKQPDSTTIELVLSFAFLVAMVSSFATASADTASSEMGQVFGKTPINPLTFKRVSPGTEGAISTEGTLYGVLASIIIVIVSFLTGLFNLSLNKLEANSPLMNIYAGLAIVIGAFLGNMMESLIGAMSGKKFNNELLNFLNTLIGGLIAWVIVYTIIIARVKSSTL